MRHLGHTWLLCLLLAPSLARPEPVPGPKAPEDSTRLALGVGGTVTGLVLGGRLGGTLALTLDVGAQLDDSFAVYLHLAGGSILFCHLVEAAVLGELTRGRVSFGAGVGVYWAWLFSGLNFGSAVGSGPPGLQPVIPLTIGFTPQPDDTPARAGLRFTVELAIGIPTALPVIGPTVWLAVGVGYGRR